MLIADRVCSLACDLVVACVLHRQVAQLGIVHAQHGARVSGGAPTPDDAGDQLPRTFDIHVRHHGHLLVVHARRHPHQVRVGARGILNGVERGGDRGEVAAALGDDDDVGVMLLKLVGVKTVQRVRIPGRIGLLRHERIGHGRDAPVRKLGEAGRVPSDAEPDPQGGLRIPEVLGLQRFRHALQQGVAQQHAEQPVSHRQLHGQVRLVACGGGAVVGPVGGVAGGVDDRELEVAAFFAGRAKRLAVHPHVALVGDDGGCGSFRCGGCAAGRGRQGQQSEKNDQDDEFGAVHRSASFGMRETEMHKGRPADGSDARRHNGAWLRCSTADYTPADGGKSIGFEKAVTPAGEMAVRTVSGVARRSASVSGCQAMPWPGCRRNWPEDEIAPASARSCARPALRAPRSGGAAATTTNRTAYTPPVSLGSTWIVMRVLGHLLRSSFSIAVQWSCAARIVRSPGSSR